VQQTVLFYFQIKTNSQFTVVFRGVLIQTAIGLDCLWCSGVFGM
jgi:hypothetical protein